MSAPIFIRCKISNRDHYIEITREEVEQLGTGVKVLNKFIRDDLEVWWDAWYGESMLPAHSTLPRAFSDNRVYIERMRYPSSLLNPQLGMEKIYHQWDQHCFTHQEFYDLVQGKDTIGEYTKYTLRMIKLQLDDKENQVV
jgi:hypothetical protein